MTSTELAPRLSITETMAAKFGMAAGPFEQTLRATVFPKDASREQFAAFLLVANQYNLNPVTREIYAFPARTGGITPIVSIDGWVNIINSHPMMNGLEFTDHIQDGQMTAVTARIWRKDRDKPIEVTEYLVECDTGTQTWKKFPCRMLRHKALIQCARYAFGFAGIFDPDEAERIAAAQDVTPRPPVARPSGAAAFQQLATPSGTQFAGNSRSVRPLHAQDAGDSQEPEPADPAQGPALVAGSAPGERVPLGLAWQRGVDDRNKGVALKAMPGEYRTLDRASEAAAWAQGWHNVPLMEGTDVEPNPTTQG